MLNIIEILLVIMPNQNNIEDLTNINETENENYDINTW